MADEQMGPVEAIKSTGLIALLVSGVIGLLSALAKIIPTRITALTADRLQQDEEARKQRAETLADRDYWRDEYRKAVREREEGFHERDAKIEAKSAEARHYHEEAYRIRDEHTTRYFALRSQAASQGLKLEDNFTPISVRLYTPPAPQATPPSTPAPVPPVSPPTTPTT